MAKKLFMAPFILASGDPSNPTVIGKGSGNSSTTGGGDDTPPVVACSYAYWLDHFAVDYDDNGFDTNDFGYWWVDNIGEDPSEFTELNPDIPWNEDWLG